MGISAEVIAEAFEEGNDTLYSKTKVPAYSTSIAAAEKVLFKLADSDDRLDIKLELVRNSGALPFIWFCEFTDWAHPRFECEEGQSEHSAAHAICLAALAACSLPEVAVS